MSVAVSAEQPRKAPLLHLSHPDHHIPGYELPETASPPPSRGACLIGFGVVAAVAVAGWLLKRAGEGAPVPSVGLPWVIPFAALLASIAIMPFAAKPFWEKNYQNVSIGLGLLVVGYYVFGLSAARTVAATFADYISFVILLGSLFVVSGGVMIRVHRRTSPLANSIMLLIGAILANVVGTTGASMLLIRPFLRMNKGRLRPYHVVFFIFCVANVGGALTPVGDPPLFLGYLRGVPFWWVLQHCLPVWLTAVACLLVVFFAMDTISSRRRGKTEGESADPVEENPGEALREIVSIFGISNVLFITVILGAVFCDSPYREILMAAAAFGSLATTSRRIYGENHFNYTPIKEVALLFVGIFATMIPAMNYLHNHAQDPTFKRFLDTPGQFYFASGALSSVLDNAPTYVTFLEAGVGKIADQQAVIEREKQIIAARTINLSEQDFQGLSPAQSAALKALHETMVRYHGNEIANGTAPAEQVELGYLLDDTGRLRAGGGDGGDGGHAMFRYLVAISLGAVFFGACTYIGNGPNFMVKSIADHAGEKTPSFFAYILFFTLPIFLPILILCWALYLR